MPRAGAERRVVYTTVTTRPRTTRHHICSHFTQLEELRRTSVDYPTPLRLLGSAHPHLCLSDTGINFAVIASLKSFTRLPESSTRCLPDNITTGLTSRTSHGYQQLFELLPQSTAQGSAINEKEKAT